MIKYIAISATKEKIVENHYGTSQFSNKAITQMAKTSIGKPVLLDFDEEKQIGTVISGKNDNGKLVIVFKINNDYIIHEKRRLVPGYITGGGIWTETKNEGFCRLIEKAESHSFGLTFTPKEFNLPKIKKM